LTLAPIPIPPPTGSHSALSPNLGLGGEILPNPVFPRVPSFIFFPQSQLFVAAPSFRQVVPGIPSGLLAIGVGPLSLALGGEILPSPAFPRVPSFIFFPQSQLFVAAPSFRQLVPRIPSGLLAIGGGPLSLAPVQQTTTSASTNASTVVGARLGVASVMHPPLPVGFPQPPPVAAPIGLHPSGPGAVLPSSLATMPGPVYALRATVGSASPSPAMAANIHLVLPFNPPPPGVAPAQSAARPSTASSQNLIRLAAPPPPQPPAPPPQVTEPVPPPQIAVRTPPPPPPPGVSRPTGPVVNPTGPIMAPNPSTPLSTVHVARPF
jgi:hypothetical protein